MRVRIMEKNCRRTGYRPVEGTGRVIMSLFLVLSFMVAVVAVMPFGAFGAQPTYPIAADVYTTREQTVRPISIPDAPHLAITDVDQYQANGYSLWVLGAPVDYGKILPDGSPVGSYNSVETLLTYFSLSDTHITDKEAPALPIVFGIGPFGQFGGANLPAYSPVMLYTTHVLDAAVQTINALHATTPFDFGIDLGDPADSNLFIGLRWHNDVLDGKRIVPSTGAHRGATTIDYQKPYQSAGLVKSIPWYQVIGNHDQYWSGALYANDYVRRILVGNTVLDMGMSNGFPSLDARGIYTGVVDGTTLYGTVIDAGAASTMDPPIVAADQSRRALTTSTSSSLNWMKELFNTTSKPKGHGFSQENVKNDFVCYTFEPKSTVPVKVIVLDDTCKENPYAANSSYSHGCLDQTRYEWLVGELEAGQAEGKLMIVAAHVPVGPQQNVPDAPPSPNVPNNTVIPMFFSTCNDGKSGIGVPCPAPTPIVNNDPVPPYSVVTDYTLLETLHNYSNLILWMSGHRHINTVTPQPAPTGKGPEFGFWEVETASLRDFPQTFRTFQITRNDNNTVSILITNVDPAVQTGSPAYKSRGAAIGAYRIATGEAGLTDTTSHVYNAELVKPLAAPLYDHGQRDRPRHGKYGSLPGRHLYSGKPLLRILSSRHAGDPHPHRFLRRCLCRMVDLSRHFGLYHHHGRQHDSHRHLHPETDPHRKPRLPQLREREERKNSEGQFHGEKHDGQGRCQPRNRHRRNRAGEPQPVRPHHRQGPVLGKDPGPGKDLQLPGLFQADGNQHPDRNHNPPLERPRHPGNRTGDRSREIETQLGMPYTPLGPKPGVCKLEAIAISRPL